MDRLRAIAAFVRAVELGGLSAAARELRTTQPTVSKLVAGLERDLGVRLLQRSSTRATPTDEGLRFLASARQLLVDYDEAVAELGQQTRVPHGLVRISAPVALGELHLNRLMLQALQEHPQLRIELVLEDRFIDPVEERIDLAVRIGGVLPQDLAAHPLAVWPRYLVASPGYLARKSRPRRPSDLPGHDYLRYAGPDAPLVLDASDGRNVSVEVPVRYRVNSAIALLEAVRSGAGISLQPRWMVDDLLRRGELVRLLPQWTGPAQTARLVHAPRRQPMRVQVLKDFLLATVPKL
ncbi:LysR family transcriptional regulator [Variovorax sp.]|uniref:LysR family transcriptional regulator n=1 Tax=Variovorax sp. TaxID=1871043 RepID=UPI002D5E0204|nr:LysR family transcriptional regulator [Variovorax sp.]HYP83630.1 LysR family transcriptional regulator [Variovorax sp.]